MDFSSFPKKPKGILLPIDLVLEDILTRLPAKSLMRFMCVSNLWSSHIKSRHFSNRFLTVPSRSHPLLFLCLRNYQNHTSVILSLAPDTTTPSSFVIHHAQNVLCMGPQVSHNICGFIYYTNMKKMQIYNPTTRQLVTLPAINSYLIPSEEPRDKHFMSGGPKSIACYYFGYDHVNDQYKVICSISQTLIEREITRISQHWVFVLKPRGGSWKQVAPLPLADFCNHVPVKGGLSINRVIYYLAKIDMHNDVVVSFDISSEEFMEMIQVPNKDGVKLGIYSQRRLIDYGGKLCVIDCTNLSNEGSVDLWVLEDVRSKEWSRKTLVLQPSQLHLVKNVILVVNGTTQTGKVIFTIGFKSFSPSFHILCYDLQSNVMRKVEIKGILDHWFTQEKWGCADLMFMDHSESVIYLET